jgi:putative ABC transport system permease protein
VIRVRSIIERVSSILDQVALGVRLLGGLAVLTGLVILIGTVAATQLRRAREAALLKTLGVTRARVAAMFAWEYALRGAVAGLLGALGAYALALGFTTQVLELSRAPSVALCVAAVVCATLLSVLGGLLASVRALVVRPLFVLRQES